MYSGVGASSSSKFTHWLCYGDADSEVITVLYHTFYLLMLVCRSMVCMSKVNDYMPTPLTLACFCEQCCPIPEEKRPHHYELFGVIMHLGATIASGHYVAYVKGIDDK